MRTTSFGPDDAWPDDELRCYAEHPFHDLSPEITCVRPAGHDWEHAGHLGKGATTFDWVWWADPRPETRALEEARLQASAYVAAQTGKTAGREAARIMLVRRLRTIALLVALTVVLSIYASAAAFSVFVGECRSRPYLTKTRATVCDWTFYGDPPIRPGPQFIERLPPRK